MISSIVSPTLRASLRTLAPIRAGLERPLHSRCVVSVLETPPSSSSIAEPKGVKTAWNMFQPGNRAATTTSTADRMEEATLAALEKVLGPLDRKPLVPPPKPVVVVISGPSGVGKDSVLHRLKEKREDLYFVVTATSRAMRPLEVEGRDYFFVSMGKFEQWMAEDQLLEHALVYGEYKGIPRQQVDQALAAGTDVVLRIDVQGAATVKRLMPEVISIFIAAESQAKLVERLAARKTETLDKLVVRVQTAQQEMDEISKFDYVVVNHEGGLDKCADAIGSIIDAEKARVQRNWHKQHTQHTEALSTSVSASV